MHIFLGKEPPVDIILYVLRSQDDLYLKERIRKQFKALPNTEYERIVTRILNLIFECGENLTEIYKNFFLEEYDTFSSFLESEKEMDRNKIDEILSFKQDDDSLWIVNISDYETYNFSSLFDFETWEDVSYVKEVSIVERLNFAISRCENENS